MEILDQKQLGLRLKAVRILTGLNQEEFAKACDFNYTSLRNWEFGRVTPRKEAIDRLIESFRSFSIFVDKQWIFFGHGEGPAFTANASGKSLVSARRDEILVFEKTCAARGDRALVLNLTDDEMSPHYVRGDWIGAVSRPLMSLLEHPKTIKLFAKPMLVKLEEQGLCLRYVYRDGDKWLGRSHNSHQLSRIMGDFVGIPVLHLASILDEDGNGVGLAANE